MSCCLLCLVATRTTQSSSQSEADPRALTVAVRDHEYLHQCSSEIHISSILYRSCLEIVHVITIILSYFRQHSIDPRVGIQNFWSHCLFPPYVLTSFQQKQQGE